MSGIEIFFVTLLSIVTLAVVWFACYSVYRLYSGQR
jgi:hypothetical protein